MRRSTLVLCGLLAVGATGCDKIKALIDKRRHPQAAETPRPAPGADTTKRAAPPAAAAPAQKAAPKSAGPTPQRPAGLGAPAHDVPYVSEDTGTVADGMTEDQVYALWGPPVAVRHMGDYTYIFFRNGCEHRCGTADVVTLDHGAVIDAVTRWWGHHYSGNGPSAPHPDSTVAPPAAVPAPPAVDTTKPAPAPAKKDSGGVSVPR